MSLVETRKDGVVTVSCQHCGTALAEIQEDTRKTNECEHFCWEEVSWLCFHEYFEHPECDADYVWRLRRRYVMRIDDEERYYLLVPAGEAEEE